MIAVFVTVPEKNAEEIAGKLLEKRLCGCINIVKGISSFFLWQQKIDTAKESLLLIKTKNNLFYELEKEILKIHPYDVPEVISFKLSNVSKPYENWLNGELKS